jgi:hypothetical protein
MQTSLTDVTVSAATALGVINWSTCAGLATATVSAGFITAGESAGFAACVLSLVELLQEAMQSIVNISMRARPVFFVFIN